MWDTAESSDLEKVSIVDPLGESDIRAMLRRDGWETGPNAGSTDGANKPLVVEATYTVLRLR